MIAAFSTEAACCAIADGTAKAISNATSAIPKLKLNIVGFILSAPFLFRSIIQFFFIFLTIA
jgi:hypothetical protein